MLDAFHYLGQVVRGELVAEPARLEAARIIVGDLDEASR